MTQEQFDNDLKCVFSCKYDPRVKKSRANYGLPNFIYDGNSSNVNEFSKSEFVQLQTGSNSNEPQDLVDTRLFTLAAKQEIASLLEANNGHETQICDISKKYQVLCDKTAFIAVVK